MKQSSTLEPEDREALNRISVAIEREYPSLLVAYEGFSSPDLDMSDYGLVALHVFGLSDGRHSEVHRFASALLRDVIETRRLPVAFKGWSPEQVAEHFREDVERLRQERVAAPSGQDSCGTMARLTAQMISRMVSARAGIQGEAGQFGRVAVLMSHGRACAKDARRLKVFLRTRVDEPGEVNLQTGEAGLHPDYPCAWQGEKPETKRPGRANHAGPAEVLSRAA